LSTRLAVSSRAGSYRARVLNQSKKTALII
jgi:hypothetical protein